MKRKSQTFTLREVHSHSHPSTRGLPQPMQNSTENRSGKTRQKNQPRGRPSFLILDYRPGKDGVYPEQSQSLLINFQCATKPQRSWWPWNLTIRKERQERHKTMCQITSKWNPSTCMVKESDAHTSQDYKVKKITGLYHNEKKVTDFHITRGS